MNQITPIYKPEYESYGIILKTPYQTNIQKIEFEPNNVTIENPLIINKNIYYTIIFNDGEEFLVKIISENNKLYLKFDEPLNLTNAYVIDTEIQTILYSKNGNKSNEVLTISDIKNNQNLTIDAENNLNQGLISKDIYNKILNLGDKVKIIDNKEITFDNNKKSVLFVVNYYENDEFTLILKDSVTFECSITFKIKSNNDIEIIKNYSHNNDELETFVYNFTVGLNYLDYNKFGVLVEDLTVNSTLYFDLYRKLHTDFKTLYLNDSMTIDDWNTLYPVNKRILENISIDITNNKYFYINKDKKTNKSFDFKLIPNKKSGGEINLNNLFFDEGNFQNLIFFQNFNNQPITIQNKPTGLQESEISYLFYQKIFTEEKLTVFLRSNMVKTWTRYVNTYSGLITPWVLQSNNLVRAEDILTTNELQFISLQNKNKVNQIFNTTNLTETKPEIVIEGLKIKDGDENSVLLANGNSIKIKDLKNKVIIIPKGSITNSTSDTYTITFDESIKNQFGSLFNVTLFEFVGEE